MSDKIVSHEEFQRRRAGRNKVRDREGTDASGEIDFPALWEEIGPSIDVEKANAVRLLNENKSKILEEIEKARHDHKSSILICKRADNGELQYTNSILAEIFKTIEPVPFEYDIRRLTLHYTRGGQRDAVDEWLENTCKAKIIDDAWRIRDAIPGDVEPELSGRIEISLNVKPETWTEVMAD